MGFLLSPYERKLFPGNDQCCFFWILLIYTWQYASWYVQEIRRGTLTELPWRNWEKLAGYYKMFTTVCVTLFTPTARLSPLIMTVTKSGCNYWKIICHKLAVLTFWHWYGINWQTDASTSELPWRVSNPILQFWGWSLGDGESSAPLAVSSSASQVHSAELPGSSLQPSLDENHC